MVTDELIYKTLNFIAQLGWQENELNYFDSLVKYLGETFDVAYAFVDFIDGNNASKANTIALYSYGEIVQNIEYDLAFTPCENVHGKRLCCYSEDVQVLFPKDDLLKDLNAQSYIGIPLWGTDGKAIGLIGLMDTDSFTNPKNMEIVLQLLAVRSAHELQHQVLNAELRQANTFMHNIVDTINEGVIVYDDNLKYKVWNRFMEQLTGIPEKDVLGKHPLEVFPNLEAYGVYDQIIATLKGHDSISSEVRFFNVEKMDYVWLLDHNTPLYDIDHNIIGVIGTVTDITKYKESEEILRQSNRAIETALNMKTEFLASMSHEIRTPLNGIYSAIQLLELEVYDNDHNEKVAFAKRSCEKLIRIVNDILDYSKLEADGYIFEYQEFTIKDLFNDLQVRFMNQCQSKNITLEFSNQNPDGIEIYGDMTRLSQVLANLIENAIKFTTHGGIHVIFHAPIVTQTLTQELFFSVIDTGIGIKEQDQENIFNSFNQVRLDKHPKHAGTGLGLTISKKIVEKTGGQLNVESSFGHGSRFYFNFVTPRNKDSESPLPQFLTYSKPSHDKRLLLIDSDKTTQVLISRFIDQPHVSLDSTGTLKEANEKLSSASYDLLFVDLALLDHEPNEVKTHFIQIITDLRNTMPTIGLDNNDVHRHYLKDDSNIIVDLLNKPLVRLKLHTVTSKYL